MEQHNFCKLLSSEHRQTSLAIYTNRGECFCVCLYVARPIHSMSHSQLVCRFMFIHKKYVQARSMLKRYYYEK